MDRSFGSSAPKTQPERRILSNFKRTSSQRNDGDFFLRKGYKVNNFLHQKKLIFSFFKMGNIDSTNLFDIDELIIFAYYKKRLSKYKNISDIGANIGLHSVMLDMLSSIDSTIHSYEPDPVHFFKTDPKPINKSK